MLSGFELYSRWVLLQYHRKVLLSSIHWNGYTTGVPTQAQEQQSTLCMRNKILRSRLRTLNIIIFTFFPLIK